MIKLEEVSKSFYVANEQIQILSPTNLLINDGEFLSIMGPSGSGKSTLMSLIGCLDKPSEGNIFFHDINLIKTTDKELSQIRNKSIGFVFQQFHLLPRLSVLQNVELPLIYSGINPMERKRRAGLALQKVGLSNRKDYMPNSLSGGQKQRVAIARALVNEPSVILADEPTGALDSKTGKTIMELLVSLNKEGCTVVVVTHDLEVSKYAHRILLVEDGKVSEQKLKSGLVSYEFI